MTDRTPTVAIVDYGRGNLGSVEKALARAGVTAVVTDDYRRVAAADAVVVPGDGAFADAMASLERLDLLDTLRVHIAADRPYLGICLGYQILFAESEEFGHAKGLAVLPGVVRRFPPGPKVPHMGWNRLYHDGTLPILAGVPDGAYVYFIHSYYPDLGATGASGGTARCEYGVSFPALYVRGGLHGMQFHPEKSQRWGLRMLDNFARLVRARADVGRAC